MIWRCTSGLSSSGSSFNPKIIASLGALRQDPVAAKRPLCNPPGKLARLGSSSQSYLKPGPEKLCHTVRGHADTLLIRRSSARIQIWVITDLSQRASQPRGARRWTVAAVPTWGNFESPPIASQPLRNGKKMGVCRGELSPNIYGPTMTLST